MTVLVVLACAVLGADYSTASVHVLTEAVATAHRTYDLDLAQALLPVLEQRVNGGGTEGEEDVRQLLAEDALLVASLLRNVYEHSDTNTAQKRELGQAIDAAAASGFSALGALPDTSEKHRIMADFYTMMMRTKFKGSTYEEAMETEGDRALELDPDNPKALITKSRRKLFAETNHGGDFQAGLAMVNRAMELDPNDAGAYILRGLAYERHDMPDKAIADWQRALEINPEATPAREYLERLGMKGK
ncbi:MAG TPA: tetratricopeptide repeat protein [Candidatus Hydrogenedentes bacterium]|nr:tetratricopeptide repeat protein [Candidatus Hydrogenedentota bacterium]HPG65883.1 tetratricopeptide repeat protein [Candidatus Hydrogenedentota bacterium]